MNERIRELIAESTWVQFAEGAGYKEVFDKEKFAELIVRECISVYERDPSVYHEVNIANILEHFGVSE